MYQLGTKQNSKWCSEQEIKKRLEIQTHELVTDSGSE